VSWDSRFAEPIVLEDGTKLATLRQAIAHLVNTIPPAERSLPAVLTAAEMLTNAAEHHGPVEFARIATLQALNRHAFGVFNSDRKETHWGRRRPKEPYRYENGEIYEPPARPAPPFIPDRGFDGPA
jgi:hypothetical protein